MGLSVILCWFLCPRRPQQPRSAFAENPFAKVKPEDDSPLIGWLQSYVGEGPCIRAEAGADPALGSTAATLANQAAIFLHGAYGKTLSEEDCCDFLAVVQDMLDFPRRVSEGTRPPRPYPRFHDTEMPAGSYAELLSRAYVQAVEEIDASRILRDEGGEDKIKHHLALCGDITSIFWTALNDYRCPEGEMVEE